MGHERPFGEVWLMSASTPKAALKLAQADFAEVPILVQKSLLRSARSDSVGRAGDSLRGDR